MRRHDANPLVTPDMVRPSNPNYRVRGAFNPGAAQLGEEIVLLLRVAEAYDRETKTATKVVTSMLSPVLILVVAALVGFILIAMLLPIFKLSTVMR